MKILTATLFTLALGCSAYAQVDHSKMDHSTMDHGHEHKHNYAHTDDTAQTNTSGVSMLALAEDPEILAAVEAGGTPVVASVLGAVCDFCALAMNKTFGKQDAVKAVHVSLDDKTLNLVLTPGASMDDDTIRQLVKKAGYKVDVIDRAPALPNP